MFSLNVLYKEIITVSLRQLRSFDEFKEALNKKSLNVLITFIFNHAMSEFHLLLILRILL